MRPGSCTSGERDIESAIGPVQHTVSCPCGACSALFRHLLPLNPRVHNPKCLQECDALVFFHGHIPGTVQTSHAFQEKPDLFTSFPPYLEWIALVVLSLFHMICLGLRVGLDRTNSASIMARAGSGVPRPGPFHVWIPTAAVSTLESNARSRRSARFVSLQTKPTDGTRSAQTRETDGGD